MDAYHNSIDNAESSNQRSDGDHNESNSTNRTAPGAPHQSAAAVPVRLPIAEQNVVDTASPAAPLSALNTVQSETSSAPASEPRSLFSSTLAFVSGSSHSSGSLFTASHSQHGSIFSAPATGIMRPPVPLLPQLPLNTRVSNTHTNGARGNTVYT